jgi:putative intracellular protease/amidase
MDAAHAYLIVFDGFADWQSAHACSAIQDKDGPTVRTASLTREPVVSWGGLRVQPDIEIAAVPTEEACLLIVPGGALWENGQPEAVTALLRTFRTADIPIAAIGSGSLALARAGLLGSTRHTSDGLNYLKSRVPEYRDEAYYVNVLSVSDNGLITANGAGEVEFAHEIIKALDLLEEPERRAWFRLFKEGVIPPGA